MNEATTLARRLADGQALPTDDLLHMVLPLLRAVAGLHEAGRVAVLDPAAIFETANGALALAHPEGRAPIYQEATIRAVQPRMGSALRIVGTYRVSTAENGSEVEDLRVRRNVGEDYSPAYLLGYRAWEQELGHHDELVDILVCGLILASLACGLDLSSPADAMAFSGARADLSELAPGLHPVIASLIVEMTALNRHERATDLAALARRLEDYRNQPADLALERVLSGSSAPSDRRVAVLAHLRDRLFDLSRRNRLIHFRPTQASVNLTVASVPVVIRLEAIRAEQLCTWDSRFSGDVLSGHQVALDRWLRFEDQPYLPSAFDRIIQETRRDRAEYGSSHLRLVVAFLNWRNLKDAPDEPISSPLLWLPVELVKKKGVRDQYMLRSPSAEAEFNPALRHYLRQLYDIDLPERVDLSRTRIEQVHADLLAQIQSSEPGVTLALTTKPEIELIRQRAVQRLGVFQRRRTGRRADVGRPDFSYDRDDFRPLGLALFEKYVRPSPLPQRIAVGAPAAPRPQAMAPTPTASKPDAERPDAEGLSYALTSSGGQRHAWAVDLTQVTLANFNYKKMSLIRDYSQLIERGAPGTFDQIFSIAPRTIEDGPPTPLPRAERWGVTPADATQEAAVALARTGRSFIIQGPPGTGKSQTITNLIADYAARGERVLFVCEKRAALDVVFNRLHAAGLSRLACLIHDSQEDKKAFVHDLRDTYERWTAADDVLDPSLSARQRTLDALQSQLARIEEFEAAIGRAPEAAGATLRAIVRRRIALPDEAPLRPAVSERLPSLADWDANRSLAERIHRTVSQSLGVASLAEHPLARLSPAIVAGPQAYAAAAQAIDEAERLLDGLDDVLEDRSLLLAADLRLDEALTLVRSAQAAIDANLAGNLDLLDDGSAASKDLLSGLARLDKARRKTEAAAAKAAAWRDPLSPQDTELALALARAKESAFLNFLSGDWRRLKRAVHARYDFTAHAVKPTVTKTLERLAAQQMAAAAEEEAKEALSARFATPDITRLMSLRDSWLAAASPMVRRLVLHIRAASDPAGAIRREAQAVSQVEALSALTAGFLTSAGELPLGALAETVRDMRESLEELPDLLPLLASADAAGPSVAFALRALAFSPERLEALVLSEAFARALREEPALQRFDADELGACSRAAARARVRLEADNSAAILARSHRRFRDHLRHSALSVSQLDAEGREFKKAYATGRRELEHEFGKTMRYRSIRDLSDDETGRVVIDLKPIWLMSPLSVSDTLPLETGQFDVVIFDEASQIPVEEAVPALCRATQVIVVGDEMQLPPTSFFATARDEADMQVAADEDGDRVAILLDADSLLNQAARSLPATLLAWHYRSRSEALISFSNAAFYDGRLITVPDMTIGQASAAPSPLTSSDPAAATAAISGLLTRPISFHAVADGVYEKRANAPEARLIAGMARDLLFRETGLSIGIVAFSEAQQTEIEAELEALASEDTAFATRLEAEYAREDDGQINGLFVKNLENVQGDERDVIILSICYAPDGRGRMAMNFGPINQRGGEKRLNVIFSRARRHMAVVSTIRAEQITNTHNDGARALAAFLSFAEAQGRGDAAHGQAVLATLNPEAQRVFGQAARPDPLRDAIAAALRARGHDVDVNVGSASFRCDLAILAPDGRSYALGVLLDAESAGSVDDRYVFQPAILRSFGWKVICPPSHSWLRDPGAVIAQIESALAAPIEDDGDAPEPVAPAAPSPVPPTFDATLDATLAEPRDERAATLGEQPEAAVATLAFSEFRFSQGGSDKFWKIAVEGTDTTVVFGRVGSRGSTVIKSFESPARAEREAAKLIAEKLRKGYVAV